MVLDDEGRKLVGKRLVPCLRMNDSEVEITAGLVRDLLEDQHPDLAGLDIRGRGRMGHPYVVSGGGVGRVHAAHGTCPGSSVHRIPVSCGPGAS